MARPNSVVAQAGAVYVEFLISFPPVFVLFLGVVQLALLSAASLVLQHAAVAGARAAVVVLEDDGRFYDGQKRGDITDHKKARNDGFEHALAERLGMDSEAETESAPLGGPRMTAIRRAVHAPLAAIAPEPLFFTRMLFPSAHPSVSGMLGALPVTRLLFGLTLYLPATTAVTFPVSPGSEELHESHVPAEGSVTVRVTHMLPCLVPVVSSLMCRRLDWDLVHGTLREHGKSDEHTQRALAELKRAPSPKLQALFVLGDVPVALLQAEATMPAQSASYAYPSEGKKAQHP